MPFLIYLLLLALRPPASTSSHPYGLIRNASIKLPFAVNNDTGYRLDTENCDQCLCDAFSHPSVVLLTCTQHTPINFTCQMYYFIPKRDEIEYPRNDSSIYLLGTNQTFEEKDDCCNTAKLIEKITAQIPYKRSIYPGPLRSLAAGGGNSILTAAAAGSSPGRELLKFDISTFTKINVPPSSSLISVGFYEQNYYFGTDQQTVVVYNESINSLLHGTSPFSDRVVTVRFILGTEEMLLGAGIAGAHICGKDSNKRLLVNCTPIPLTNTGKQLHAIAIVNDTAFYAGWHDTAQDIHLYTRDASNAWTRNDNEKINHTLPTSDLVIDSCQRVWAVVPNSNEIVIYHRNSTQLGVINVNSSNLFSLMILNNYTMVMSHESNDGLTSITPALNCRPER